MKLLNYYNKLMKDRYGIDELNKFFIKIYLLIVFVDIFINFKYLFYIKIVFLLLFLYRFLSKNKFDRNKENRMFLDIKNKRYKNVYNKYIYKKCSKCKKKLRLPLPSSIGVKKVKCPNCHNKMRVLVLRKK